MPVSQQFIVAMEPHRDRLYTLALALAASPAGAESLLHRTVHEAISLYAGKNGTSFPEWFERLLREQAPQATPAPGAPEEPMPAALWARIHAAVQVEAAKRGGVAGQSLLSYDPLLAPKKQAPPDDDSDLLNLSPTTRFILAGTVALVFAIAMTIILTTRHGDRPSPAPPALPALSTQPATAAATRH